MARPEVTSPDARLSWLGPQPRALTLTLSGRYAGDQVWQTQFEKGVYHTRVQTDFGGVLPQLRKVQLSRHTADFVSLSYSEGDGRGKPNFETIFDEAAGLLTLRQQQGHFTDEASVPLLSAHYDPLSLVMALRSPQAPTQLWRAPLSGGPVHVQPLPSGATEAEAGRTYYLRPGGAYVMVQPDFPYALLRLVQPTDFGPLSADVQFEGMGPRRAAPAERSKRRRIQP